MKGVGWGVEWLQEPEDQEVYSESMLPRNGFLNQDPKNDNIYRRWEIPHEIPLPDKEL